MFKKISFLLALTCWLGFYAMGQTTTITIDANGAKKPISPYIFGKNNSLSDAAGSPLSNYQWQRLKDLGITMFRENGGNNATKYNWRLKLTSHPDWYNNVYNHDWDFAAKSLQQNIPGAQGMWAFQLCGKAAKTNSANFNDWNYNHSQWWEGVGQNLAGGGTPNLTGSKAKVEGNPALYLENWNADSTTAILNHWFGNGGVGLDSNFIRYWSMDNESEIWSGTHDDIYPTQPSAEEFMQLYFKVAKKARAAYPGIKLVGPVPANEWQWFNWDGNLISYNGRSYPWLEYFILRVAEEEQATGVRLLDVLDIHFYPGETVSSDIVQLHRVFFDENYSYPGANGLKKTGAGGWDNSLNREYIFKRCHDWLTQYLGPNHGVGLSVSETGIGGSNPNVTASWYASTLGEFARQGVEMFTPWSWKTGMDEVIHLFSKNAKSKYVEATSSEELYVSAYPTMNTAGDSMTLFLVNRNLSESRTARINLSNFRVKNGTYILYSLSSLPANETFVSASVNALKSADLQVAGNIISVPMPALSVSALILAKDSSEAGPYGDLVTAVEAESGTLSGVNTTTAVAGFSGTGYVTGFDNANDKVAVQATVPVKGFYRIVIRYLAHDGEKYQYLSVNNGFNSSVHFPASDTFALADAGSYMFEAGSNTITVSKSWGWSDVDKFEIYTTVPNSYHITDQLIDTAATEETKTLYAWLLSQFGKNIISGQTDEYYDSIKRITGTSPILRNGDLNSYTDGYPYKWENGHHVFGKVDYGTVDKLINWYNSKDKKGIVAFQWHWCSPSGGSAGTNTFYTNQTTFDVTKAVTEGTQENADIIRDIDDIAVQLKKFSDAGIPVLWRPLHEAGGAWFWWGAKGPEACKALYNIMYDRLVNYHQLHNLIWVWSTPETDWYPGNDRVDIIGYDSYPGAFNYGNQKNAFDILYRLTGGNKLIAMSENGPIPNPDDCLDYDAPWSYFMSWNDLTISQNSKAHIQDVFRNKRVLKFGEPLPDNVTVTFKVINDYSGNPVFGASVNTGSSEASTDANGRVVFGLQPGTYHCDIIKSNYISVSGTFDILSDTTFTISMDQTQANVKLYVKNGTSAVSQASVTIGGTTQVTGTLGFVTFSTLDVGNEYTFSVTKTGFDEAQGTFTLRTDTSFNVILVPATVTGINEGESKQLHIWPNPANETLYVSLPKGQENAGIRINDVKGNMILEEQAGGNHVKLDVRNFPEGMYFIFIPSENPQVIKFIINR